MNYDNNENNRDGDGDVENSDGINNDNDITDISTTANVADMIMPI